MGNTVVFPNKASGTQLIQELIADGCHAITRYQPDGDKIMRMHAPTAKIENGFAVSAIARRVGIDRKTVRKYIERGLEPPSCGPRQPRARRLEPSEADLRRRVVAYPGLTASRLLREIREHGYGGGYTAVTDFLREVRPSPMPAFPRRGRPPAMMAVGDGLPVLERIRRTLIALRMPRALEGLDHAVHQLERGEASALELIDTLLAGELSVRETSRIKTALRMGRLRRRLELSGRVGVTTLRTRRAESGRCRVPVAERGLREKPLAS